jgi:HK97 family phage major capsid protein
MNDMTIAEMSSVVDSNGNLANMFGRRNNQTGLAEDYEEVLFNRPVKSAPYIQGSGANNILTLFGDFARAYYLVTRRGMTVTRIDKQSDKYRASNQSALHVSYRYGGDVVRPWCVIAGKQA